MKDLKKFLFVLITKAKAPAESTKLMKKEWKIKFIMKTATESTIMGVEQYIIRHEVCIMALS
jgi:hypothetical protein